MVSDREAQPLYKSGEDLVSELHLTSLETGQVAIWHLGQSGEVIKGPGPGNFICIDPYLTFPIQKGSRDTDFVREFPPPLEPAGLKGATAVLVTHSHEDHLDPGTLKPLSRVSPDTIFVVPVQSVLTLRAAGINEARIVGAREGAPADLGGFRVEPVAVPHVDYEIGEEGFSNYLGYLITVNGVRLFHSGDSVVDEALLHRVTDFHPDVAFLPINGGGFARRLQGIVGNMTFREAADFGVMIGSDIILPVHYDLFASNRDNPAHFVDYLFHHYRSQKFHMMVPGERFIYMK